MSIQADCMGNRPSFYPLCTRRLIHSGINSRAIFGNGGVCAHRRKYPSCIGGAKCIVKWFAAAQKPYHLIIFKCGNAQTILGKSFQVGNIAQLRQFLYKSPLIIVVRKNNCRCFFDMPFFKIKNIHQYLSLSINEELNLFFICTLRNIFRI